jgi:hypothetical protein
MKRVPLTDLLRQRLQTAGADPEKVVVFEATALNTLPVRKRHPLYKDAVHTLDFMTQMRDALNAESLPLQTMHNDQVLPLGRAFFGDVVGSELRVLFWVDSTHADIINLIENGTIDQVSVATLPKAALCSTCGFDFFGPNASFDNIWSATDPEGHTMGENGHHLVISQLDRWFELSLVGQGGIKGARIQKSSEARLAADGSAASMLTLLLSSADLTSEKTSMDLKELVQQLTDEKAKNIALTSERDTLITERDAAVAARDEAVSALAAKDTELITSKAEVTRLSAFSGAVDALKDIAKHVLTISGRVTDSAPEKIEDIVTLVKGVKLSLPTSHTDPAHRSEGNEKVGQFSSGAFKSAR